jgi:hypothetical protein
MKNKISELIIAQKPQQIKLPSPPVSFQVPDGELMNRLLASPQLKGWERFFVATPQKTRKPGRRQIQKLKAIAFRLGFTAEDAIAPNESTL